MKVMKVKVKLSADCYVGKKLCKKGDIVEVAEEVAADFGDIEAKKTTKPADKPAGE